MSRGPGRVMRFVLAELRQHNQLHDPRDDTRKRESMLPLVHIAARLATADGKTMTRSHVESVRRAASKLWADEVIELWTVRRDGFTSRVAAARLTPADEQERQARERFEEDLAREREMELLRIEARLGRRVKVGPSVPVREPGNGASKGSSVGAPPSLEHDQHIGPALFVRAYDGPTLSRVV